MIIINRINWDLIFGDGLTITLIGYLIVFMALVLLALVFTYVPKLMQMQARRRLRKQSRETDIEIKSNRISGEEGAAIGAAIYLFLNELHDTEDPIITIKRVSKNYSPWSSKIYNVTRGLNRRF